MTSYLNLIKEEVLSTEEEDKLRDLKGLISDSQDDILHQEKCCFTDEFLMTYLRCKKLDVLSAYEKIRSFTYLRTQKYADFFAQLGPERLDVARTTSVGGILDRRDSKGRHILVGRIPMVDFDRFTTQDYLSLWIMSGIEMHCSKQTQIEGMVWIVDCSEFTLSKASHLTPTAIYKSMDIVLNGFPWKFKGFHHVNASKLFHWTLSAFKLLAPPKLRKRIYVHSSMASLHEHFSPDILPDWLGGNLSHEDALDKRINDLEYIKKRQGFYDKCIC